MRAIRSQPHSEYECQRIVNDFWCCISGNPSGDQLRPFINVVLPGVLGKSESHTLAASFCTSGSMVLQQLLVLNFGNLSGDRLQPFINVDLAGFSGKRESHTLLAPFIM